MSIKFSDIAVKHLINFNYDTSDCITFLNPHYVFSIENSIHYKSLINNNFDDYKMLLNTTIQPEHSLSNYKKLIDRFNLKTMDPIKLTFNPEIKKYLVEDGVHRVSILKYKKIFNQSIPRKLTTIK